MQSSYILSMFGRPVLTDVHSMADATSLSAGFLYKLSVRNDKFYRRFDIPKKAGGSRTICSPSREMKAVQAWILRNILEPLTVDQAATAFRRGRRLLDNALPHQHNRFFLCLDLEDFFPSIPYAKVYNVFRTCGYGPHMAHVLARLCTCEDKLPQGGVTSPALSNIVCIRLDRRITSFVGKRNVAYTRYADDLTFSSMSPNRLSSIVPTIRHIVEDEGFTLNGAKARRMGPRQQCRITGLVVSDAQVGVGRGRKRALRAAIHSVLLQPQDADDREHRIAHVRGWLAFLKSVDKRGLAQLQVHADRVAQRHGVANVLSP